MITRCQVVNRSIPPFCPRRIDVRGDPLAGKIAVTGNKRLENSSMIPGRPLQCCPACRRGEWRHHAAVSVDHTHDRQAHLVAGGLHDDRVEALVVGTKPLVVVVGRFHLLEVLGEPGELFFGQPACRGARHLALELTANDDQIVEKRQVEVVLERDPEHDRVE